MKRRRLKTLNEVRFAADDLDSVASEVVNRLMDRHHDLLVPVDDLSDVRRVPSLARDFRRELESIADLADFEVEIVADDVRQMLMDKIKAANGVLKDLVSELNRMG